MRRNEPQANAGPSHSLNAIVAALCAWSIWFFSGPIYSLLARRIYVDYLCHWFYGGEGLVDGLREFIHCTIPGEHVGHYAYNYGELVMGGLSFGLSYYLTHKLQRIYNRVEVIAHEGASRIQDDIMLELRALREALHQNQGEQEELSSRKPPILRSRQRSASADGAATLAVSRSASNARKAQSKAKL